MDLQIKENQIGVHEDLSDLIVELNAGATPAFSMIRKGAKPGAPIMQQPVDAPGYVSRRGVKNKTPADASTDQSKDYNLLESNNHWVRGTVSVGKKDLLTVNRAGIGLGKLYSREVAKALEAMKVAIECITCDNVDQRDEGKDGSETRGLFSWADANAQTCRPVPEKYRPTAAQNVSGNLSDISPTTLVNAFNARWNKTKTKARMIGLCGSAFKQHVSDWSMHIPDKTGCTTIRQFVSDAKTKKDRVFAAIIDLLEFDTATVELHLDPYLLWDRDADGDTDITDASSRACLCFPQDAASYHFAQPIQHTELPFDGGSKTGQVDTLFHTMATPFEFVRIMPTGA